ncbi:hypothetical protein [Limnohabitans sp.]|uniref:hypothetical protein n=1 Tax=Limnohabitans sp. TaxID=1907725 RepID=UPI003341BDEA
MITPQKITVDCQIFVFVAADGSGLEGWLCIGHGICGAKAGLRLVEKSDRAV